MSFSNCLVSPFSNFLPPPFWQMDIPPGGVSPPAQITLKRLNLSLRQKLMAFGKILFFIVNSKNQLMSYKVLSFEDEVFNAIVVQKNFSFAGYS